LSCAARRTVTVALTGDGGDELFAGYPTMAADWWQRAARGLPRGLLGVLRRGARVLPHAAAPLGEFIAATAYHPDACNQALIGGIPPARGAPLLTRAVRARLGRFDWYGDVAAVLASCDAESATDRLIYRYCKLYLAGQNLVNSDRASMSTGLELRAPFLDHTFVEFMGRIPSSLKLGGFRSLKQLLKRALADRLPPEILRRGKQGFGVPLGEWFRGPLAGFVREVLAPDRLRRGGVFDPAAVRRVVAAHLRGGRDHRRSLWSVLAFEGWRLEYLGDGAAACPPSFQPVALELVVERPQPDAQALGGLLAVASDGGEGVLDRLALQIGQGPDAARRRGRGGIGRLEHEVLRPDLFVLGEDDRALERVRELPDVSRPGRGEQALACRGAEARRPAAPIGARARRPLPGAGRGGGAPPAPPP